MATQKKFVPLRKYTEYSPQQMEKRARSFYNHLKKRRTVRNFSTRDVPQKVIEDCLLAAGTAPNGANMQPWHFSVIKSPEMKAKIRKGAEKEEKEFYERRATDEWLKALEPLGTDEEKPFLEEAPLSYCHIF